MNQLFIPDFSNKIGEELPRLKALESFDRFTKHCGKIAVEPMIESPQKINCSENLLESLGYYLSFPAAFVKTLPQDTQVDILNICYDKIENDRFSLTGIVDDNDEIQSITGILPSWREFPQPWEVLTNVKNFSNKIPVFADNKLTYKFDRISQELTIQGWMKPDFTEKITAKVGDSLAFGFKVISKPGQLLQCRLLCERLICLNGMTSVGEIFSWKAKNFSSATDQLTWLNIKILSVTQEAEKIAAKSREMAETIVSDPEEALLSRLKSMEVQKIHHDSILSAFEEEKGNTEWDLLNALTRFATHGDLTDRQREQLQAQAGNWTLEYDRVTARLPRKIALSVGAEIMNGD